MSELLVDAAVLRAQVREKYRDVATEPTGPYHFHTGRPLAERLGYPATVVEALPDAAVESFAGVGNPFALHELSSACAGAAVMILHLCVFDFGELDEWPVGSAAPSPRACRANVEWA